MSLKIHLEATIRWGWKCTWRPGWCEIWTWWLSVVWLTFGGHNYWSVEMYMEAVIVWVWRYILRLRQYELWYALGGSDRMKLEVYLEEVNLDMGNLEAGDWEGGTLRADPIHWLTHNWGNIEWVVQHGSPSDERQKIEERSWEVRDEIWTMIDKRYETCWERETVDIGLILLLVYTICSDHSSSWYADQSRDDLTLWD